MTPTFEQARALYGSDEQMARVLFAMLMIQEAKLELAKTQPTDQAKKQKTGEQMNQMNESSPTEAGPAVRTWRDRLGFGADFPLHSASAVELAMEAEIADLRAQPPRQQMIDAALSNLAIERAASAVIRIPGTEPQQYVAIGTAAEIGQLLQQARLVASAKLAEILAQYRNGERGLPTYDELAALANLAGRAAEGDALDKERLDFLDTNARFRTGWKVGIAPAGILSVTAIAMGGRPIREAIDAARLFATHQPGAQEANQPGRFDRVTPQEDGSFQHSYRGKPVPGPTGGTEGGTEGGAK